MSLFEPRQLPQQLGPTTPVFQILFVLDWNQLFQKMYIFPNRKFLVIKDLDLDWIRMRIQQKAWIRIRIKYGSSV